MTNPTLIPAYGRDYSSEKELLADWFAGRDFKVAITGQYCSIRDFEDSGNTISIRYMKKRRQCIAPTRAPRF